MKKIEHSYTISGDLSNALYAFIPLAVLAGGYTSLEKSKFINQLVPIYIIAVSLSIIWALYQRWLVFRYIKKRVNRMKEAASLNHYNFYSHFPEYQAIYHNPEIARTTISSLSSNESPDARNFLVAPIWTYYDFSYSTFRHSKYGDYKSADVFYGVMAAELPRPLPNVFFDSKHARHRQFRFVFKRRQIHHLEGEFDNYFVTYFPENYEVDSLSFITPDVMQALIDASEYDIEIVNNRLFMYGPIYDIDQQLYDMSTKILAIKNTLMSTVENYYDDRLPAQLSGKEIAPAGASLKRSMFWAYIYIALVILYIVIKIGYSYFTSNS